MTLEFKLTVILLGMIIAQGFFAALVLLFSKANATANRFLGLLVAAFSLWLCDAFFTDSGVYGQDPNFYFLPIYFSFAFGPLVYLYTKALVSNGYRFTLKDAIHFVPVLGQFCFYVFLQAQDYEYRRSFWLDVHQPLTYNLEFNLTLVSLVVYLFFANKLLQRYRNWMINEYSEVSQINLRWLQKVFLGITLFSVIWLVAAYFRTVQDYFLDVLILALPMGILVLFLAAGGILQKSLVGGVNFKKRVPDASDEKAVDEGLLSKVEASMREGKHYLDPELSLTKFSEILDVNRRELSNCINQGLGMPFIDFVNKHRVEAVITLMTDKDSQKLSLLGMALDSGFNSKSTFNRVFKKTKGMSPREYLSALSV